MAATPVTFQIAEQIWSDFLSIQPGSTDAEKLLAAKQAIKNDFIKPKVYDVRIREKQEALNAELRAFSEVQSARLLD